MVGLTYTPPLPPTVAAAASGPAPTLAPVVQVITALAPGAIGDSLTDTLQNAAGPGNVVTGTVTSADPGGTFTLTTASGIDVTLHHPPELPLDAGSVLTLRILTTGLTPQATLLAIDGRPVVLRSSSNSGGSAPRSGSSASSGRSTPALMTPGAGSASAYAASLAAVLSLEDETALEQALDDDYDLLTDPPPSDSVADPDPGDPQLAQTLIAVLIRPAPARLGQTPLPVGARYLVVRDGGSLSPPSGFSAQAIVLAGRVLTPRRAGEALVETVLGTLALPTRATPAPGTPVRLRIGAVALPLDDDDPLALAPPALEASLMDQVLAVLTSHMPQLADTVRLLMVLPTGETLLRAVFGFLFDRNRRSETRTASGEIRQSLVGAGQKDLAARFAAQTRNMGDGHARHEAEGWVIATLPFFGLASEAPLRIYTRARDPDEAKKEGDESGRKRSKGGERVVVEVTLRRLGPMQFDGLVRDRRFDLVLRTAAPLDSTLQLGIESTFHRAVAECGWGGDLVFGQVAKFPLVSPADDGSSGMEVSV